MATYVPPPGAPGGGDSGARAAGFSDYADYQNKVAQGGGNSNSSSISTNFSGIGNPIDTAKQLVQFTQQANQPAINQLQSSIDPLKQRYDDLIASIKGQGTVAGNFAQQAASLDLGRRGLLPQSQEGQTALSNAMLPVTQATSGALAQTGLGEQQDINQINQAIALLQSGNPSQAINLASNLYGQQQQNLTQLALGSIANQFKEFGLGGGVVNTQTGQLVGGGGGAGGFSLSGDSSNNPTTTTTSSKTPQFTSSIAGPTNPNAPVVNDATIAAAAKVLGIQQPQTPSNNGFLNFNPYLLPTNIPLNFNGNNNSSPYALKIGG